MEDCVSAAVIVNAVGMMAGLTMLLATVLVIADRWLRVEEDGRIAVVEQMLPATNCGGCGFPGCHAFAEALVAGGAQPAGCTVGSTEDRDRIATYLGVDTGSAQTRVARLACAGGSNVARNRAHYQGQPTCAAAALVAGGGKSCFWGCLGLADCERACGFDAIELNTHHLPIVDEARCTACGDCVKACPKDLFSLRPTEDRLWVACSSLAQGDGVLEDCEVGCTGCERCAADALPGQIEMRNHLPVIQYDRGPMSADPIRRCPTGAIVWIDKHSGPVRGSAAPRTIRQSDLMDRPS